MNPRTRSRVSMRLLFPILVTIVTSLDGSVLAATRPNFLLVLLDDAGWTDVGCFGSRIQTPHIDQLAAQGKRFTDCHSAAPNCSPSRAGLLTGRTPSRVGVYSYLPAGHVMHLRDQEITVAELLRDAGYHTGHFGKWHLSRLGFDDQPSPAEQGFEYSLGTDNNAAPSHHNPTNFVRNGEAAGKIEGYSCQIVVDETIEWLDRIKAGDSGAPFFACVWFHEPHTPIASPPELIEKYRELYPELSDREATYHANIDNADRAVGRLMAKLEELHLAADTVVFFTSDNGPLNRFSRVGLRGQKSHVWEGGHRVPGIFRWPGKIKAGSKCAVPISGVDYLPTVCDIAGIQPPQDRTIDGTSIRPLLDGSDDTFHRSQPLYWFFYRLNPAIAMRDRQWSVIAESNDAQRPKTHPLVRDDMPRIKSSRPVKLRLFNLESDLDQQHDLAASQPELLDRMRTRLREMHRDVIAEGHHWDIPEDYGESSSRKIWTSE